MKESRLRWLVPPVRDLIFVVLLLSLTFGTLAQRVLRDGGTGWHIRTGQRILVTHTVPRADPFSLSTAGKPWFAWEWLYDAALGTVYNYAGLNGAVAATGLLVAATFAWLFRIMRRGGTDLLTALVLLMLVLAASAIHLYVRPHVISWLFTLGWWALLERARKDDDVKPLFWLPLLTVLWVNMHGGFLFGSAILGIFDVEAAWRVWSRRDGPQSSRWLRGLAFATAVSPLATLVNPYGYGLHIHIYQYLNDRFLMNHIQEFRPPGFRGLSEACFVVLLVLALAGVLLVRQKPSLGQFLMLLFAGFAGVYASRNLPISSLLVAAIAGPYLSRGLRERLARPHGNSVPNGVLDRLESRDAKLPGGLWPVAAVGLVLWVATHGGRFGRTQMMDAQFDGTRFPVAAVNYIQSKGIRKPIFSPDQWGGYLIYQRYPAVLVDDRHDLYGDEFFKQYLKIVRVEPGWREALDQTSAELVLVPVGSALAKALGSTSGWREGYHDTVAALFERTS